MDEGRWLEGVETQEEVRPNQDRLSVVVGALQKAVEITKADGAPETARILTEAIGVLAFEGAGYRLPRCTDCGMPRSNEGMVARINRDRDMPVPVPGDELVIENEGIPPRF